MSTSSTYLEFSDLIRLREAEGRTEQDRASEFPPPSTHYRLERERETGELERVTTIHIGELPAKQRKV